jgi:hypothetical protein
VYDEDTEALILAVSKRVGGHFKGHHLITHFAIFGKESIEMLLEISPTSF